MSPVSGRAVPTAPAPQPSHLTRSAPPAGPLSGRSVVFLHAHPDDEAIFTAVTMHRLARLGARVILVTATSGELGPALRPLPPGRTLAEHRQWELEQACATLGVARLVLLGHRDSGLPGWADNAHPDALARAGVRPLARRLARLCAAEQAEALVHYDPGGIYGHPDHLAVHRIGTVAAGLAGITGYQATVDRDRLRGRDRPQVLGRFTPSGRRSGRHLVEAAAAATTAGPAAAVGRRTNEVTTVIAADRAGLTAKRAAMAAHGSQIDPAAVRRRGFAGTYGLEWYVRTGRPGLLDALSTGAVG